MRPQLKIETAYDSKGVSCDSIAKHTIANVCDCYQLNKVQPRLPNMSAGVVFFCFSSFTLFLFRTIAFEPPPPKDSTTNRFRKKLVSASLKKNWGPFAPVFQPKVNAAKNGRKDANLRTKPRKKLHLPSFLLFFSLSFFTFSDRDVCFWILN